MPLTRHEKDLILARMHVPVGRAWATRFQAGKPHHVVVKEERGNFMLCTGGKATLEYNQGNPITAVTCSRCLNYLRAEIKEY